MTTRPTIMIAEDEVALRELLSVALRANGYDTVAAGNSKVALALLKCKRVDVLLLDLRLGSESGIDLLRLARRLPNGIKLPVILLTGCNDRRAVLQAAHLGVQGCLLKSQFSVTELVARITQQLNKPGVVSPVAANGASSTNQLLEESSSSSTIAIAAVGAATQEIQPAVDPDATSANQSQAAPMSAELLRTIKPIITREQALEQVENCTELKALSPTVTQIMSMTGQPDCALADIARVIKQDQGICLKVLKLANSVVYNRGSLVDTVQKALARIGITQIRQVVLNISVIDGFHRNAAGEHFNSEWFWEHSIATGLIAAAITRARRGDERAIDNAFTLGLLHDVGRMVLAGQLDDVYEQVLDASARLQLPLEQVETRMLLLNHAEVTKRMLEAWKFPAALVEPIAVHHLSVANVRNRAPQKIAEACTLVLANRLAHAMLLGSSGNDWQCPIDEFVQVLDLESGAIELIEKQIPDQTTDMKCAMLQSGNPAVSPSYRQFLLKQFQRPMRPLYVSSNPAIDGCRMLFDRLTETDGTQVPNVAVMQLANTRDQESLLGSLQQGEERAGVKPLPLIVVSPAATMKLDPRLLAGRDHRVLPSAFALSRLIDTVNELLSSR
jgi:HD-like signal output (HDOD) protein/DNA-binding NarL/FixJ family response regulator